MLSEQLTPFQLAKARMDYEDSQKPYQPIKIPKMKYGKALIMKPAGKHGFFASIMP